VPTNTDIALAKPAIAPADRCTLLLCSVLAMDVCRLAIIIMCNTVAAGDKGREKCKEALSNRQLLDCSALVRFVTQVGVWDWPSVENPAMNSQQDTNVLPWILSALVVLIMGVAVGISSDGSDPANSQQQTSAVATNASAPGDAAPLRSKVNAPPSSTGG
jgi:hypothetical protein